MTTEKQFIADLEAGLERGLASVALPAARASGGRYQRLASGGRRRLLGRSLLAGTMATLALVTGTMVAAAKGQDPVRLATEAVRVVEEFGALVQPAAGPVPTIPIEPRLPAAPAPVLPSSPAGDMPIQEPALGGQEPAEAEHGDPERADRQREERQPAGAEGGGEPPDPDPERSEPAVGDRLPAAK